jgi:hypothetical protein
MGENANIAKMRFYKNFGNPQRLYARHLKKR